VAKWRIVHDSRRDGFIQLPFRALGTRVQRAVRKPVDGEAGTGDTSDATA